MTVNLDVKLKGVHIKGNLFLSKNVTSHGMEREGRVEGGEEEKKR